MDMIEKKMETFKLTLHLWVFLEELKPSIVFVIILWHKLDSCLSTVSFWCFPSILFFNNLQLPFSYETQLC